MQSRAESKNSGHPNYLFYRDGYINVLHHALDMHLAVGVLKLPDGCDYSAVIGKEELNEAEEEKKDEEGSEENNENNVEVVVKPSKEATAEQRHRQTSVSLYHDVDGNPLEKKIMDNITQFQVISLYIYFSYLSIDSPVSQTGAGNGHIW